MAFGHRKNHQLIVIMATRHKALLRAPKAVLSHEHILPADSTNELINATFAKHFLFTDSEERSCRKKVIDIPCVRDLQMQPLVIGKWNKR